MMEFFAGSGPRLMLDPDSVLDIGACIVAGENVAPGRAIPDDGDPRIDHSLEGFLFTCGPDHIRHPAPVEGRADGRRYPLHGSAASHPADVLFHDLKDGNAECRAAIAVHMADGGTARIERHWRIDGKTGEVRLEDRVVNSGDAAFAPMMMYHMNIGARLFDDRVRLAGGMLENGGFSWRFGAEPGGVFCVAAGRGGSGWADVVLGPVAALGGRSLKVGFDTGTLPFLQIWRNQAAPAHVLGIEPCSHRLAPRAELARSGELQALQPGQSRTFELRFAFIPAE